jgi:hypothetical protein
MSLRGAARHHLEANVSDAEWQPLEQSIPLEKAVRRHFRANCYPPIPNGMVPVGVKAIEAANAGYWSRVIELPAGVTTLEGATSLDAETIVRWLFLADFVEGEPTAEAGPPLDPQAPIGDDVPIEDAFPVCDLAVEPGVDIG